MLQVKREKMSNDTSNNAGKTSTDLVRAKQVTTSSYKRNLFTLMMCCCCCRPSSQPYVMASGVTRSGTSNGYPVKAQLQIIGKCSVFIVCADCHCLVFLGLTSRTEPVLFLLWSVKILYLFWKNDCYDNLNFACLLDIVCNDVHSSVTKITKTDICSLLSPH